MRDGFRSSRCIAYASGRRKCGRTIEGARTTSSKSRSISTGWRAMKDPGNYRPLSTSSSWRSACASCWWRRASSPTSRSTRSRGDAQAQATSAARKVVARAWVDRGYKQRLLENGTKACEELGLEVPALKLLVVENTPRGAQRDRLHAVLVLSAHAARHSARVVQVAQLPLAHGARAARGAGRIRPGDSRATSRFACTTPPPTCATSFCRMRPAGTEGWSEERLASLVTRDSMIGVAVPKT